MEIYYVHSVVHFLFNPAITCNSFGVLLEIEGYLEIERFLKGLLKIKGALGIKES